MKSSKAVLVGRILTGLITLMFLMGVYMSFTGNPQVTDSMGKYGFPAGFATTIGALELVCIILFLIPQTMVIGAIMLTAYLGGAVVTHLRVGEAFIFPVVFGIVVWVAAGLREPRLLKLLPLRK